MLGMIGIPIPPVWIVTNPDEIEQRIIRAYVRLSCAPEMHGTRMVTIVRFRGLEARLIKMPEEQRLPNAPWFQLELYSYARNALVGSCGFTELDEDGITRAVELVASTMQRAHGLH